MSFQQKDINGCLAMLAEDFQGTDINGHQFGKAETKRSLAKEFAPRHLITQSDMIKSQVLSVTSSGSQANVMYHEHLVVTIAGQFTHHQETLTFDALRRSVWVRTKGSWLERQEKGLTSRITQNGVLKSVKDIR